MSAHLPRRIRSRSAETTLFFTAHLAGFYAFGATVGSTLPFALAFYLWIAVFNMMIVAQFWAFANGANFAPEEAGRRLFPLLGFECVPWRGRRRRNGEDPHCSRRVLY